MENTQFASAVHIVVAIALAECLKTSDHLAAGIKAHPVALRRLVSKLTASGILISHRGKFGGVQLAKTPSEITLADIYSAVDSQKAVKCREAEKKCPTSCSVQVHMDKISTEIEELSLTHLSHISIEDFIKGM